MFIPNFEFLPTNTIIDRLLQSTILTTYFEPHIKIAKKQWLVSNGKPKILVLLASFHFHSGSDWFPSHLKRIDFITNNCNLDINLTKLQRGFQAQMGSKTKSTWSEDDFFFYYHRMRRYNFFSFWSYKINVSSKWTLLKVYQNYQFLMKIKDSDFHHRLNWFYHRCNAKCICVFYNFIKI